ncbi:MAG: hypothetical protein ACUVWO_09840 [Thermodesulfobacteriota bacterium]
MKNVVLIFGVLVSGLFLLTSLSFAQHSHGHGMGGSSMKMETREVLAEGVKVTFQIMANDEHRKMLKEMKMKNDVEPGTTHNITVVLKDGKTQREITDAQVTMKVIDPNGKDQIKEMKFERDMKSFNAYFALPHKGKYQVIVLVKKGDQKLPAGIYYEVK